MDENTDGKCDRCGEEISVCSHDWGTGSVTTAATYSAPGVMTYTCGKCGETKTEEIPALALPFVDVKDTDYFRAPVAWALDNAITYGDDETHFAPQSPCTREQ
ncbi:MAG: S-layer homology domain-containing protein, partial [Firmicutes bacterium]|nr:S-layer homology domain-containing protein [Bacillota bacterium]